LIIMIHQTHFTFNDSSSNNNVALSQHYSDEDCSDQESSRPSRPPEKKMKTCWRKKRRSYMGLC
ncbi:24086_t:CDS:1, partial [Dentiscutata erythropus]